MNVTLTPEVSFTVADGGFGHGNTGLDARGRLLRMWARFARLHRPAVFLPAQTPPTASMRATGDLAHGSWEPLPESAAPAPVALNDSRSTVPRSDFETWCKLLAADGC